MSTDDRPLNDRQGRRLVRLAERGLRHAVRSGDPLPSENRLFEGLTSELRATFVTLECREELAGCVGTVRAVRTAPADVIHNVHAAALRDPRVPALEPEDVPDTEVEVSVLTPPRGLDVDSDPELADRLVPGRSGLILRTREDRGAMLPSVWEKCDDPETFIDATRRKAGLAPDRWPDDLRALAFEAQSCAREE